MTAERNVASKQRKERLRRLDRIFDSSPIYFVTTCAAHRRPMLATPQLHAAFLQFARGGEDHGAYIGAYVIMPDHLHLFVALNRELTLAAWVKSLKNALSKSLRALSFPSPHWQKGFF